MKAIKKCNLTFFMSLLFCNVCFSQNFYEEGCKQYFNGNDDRISIQLFSKAIENNQELAKAYMMRGAAKISLEKYIDAISDLEYSIKLDSNNYKAYFYYGRVYFVQGFFGLALKYYNKAIIKNPQDADLYDDRAIVKGFTEDYKGAIDDEDKAIKINPNNCEYYINRGFAKAKLNLFVEAIKDYNIAIKIGENPQVYANRGNAYAAIGKHKEAIDDFTLAISKLPKAQDLNYFRGLSYKIIGKKEEACNDFKKSAEMGYLPAKEEQKKCNGNK